MRTRRWISAALVALAALPAFAKPLKATLAFDAKSRDALIIVEVAPQKIVERWELALNTYSLETKKFVGGVFRGFTLLQHIDGQEKSPRYFATLVKGGGTHIVYGLTTQFLWGSCFDRGTQVYTFEPGKAYYLGIVDPNEGLTRIATELPKQSSNTPYWVYGMYFPHTPPAQRKGWEPEVAQFIAENFPKVKVPVVAAEGVEVTFTPGRAPAGNPICRDNN